VLCIEIIYSDLYGVMPLVEDVVSEVDVASDGKVDDEMTTYYHGTSKRNQSEEWFWQTGFLQRRRVSLDQSIEQRYQLCNQINCKVHIVNILYFPRGPHPFGTYVPRIKNRPKIVPPNE